MRTNCIFLTLGGGEGGVRFSPPSLITRRWSGKVPETCAGGAAAGAVLLVSFRCKSSLLVWRISRP